MLRPTSARRERVLVYGMEDCGKTSIWCQIAAWARRTQSPARFFVMDSDMAHEPMADIYAGFYDNVEPFDVWEWEEYREAGSKFQAANDPTRGDWLIVDSGDRPWMAVQDWYSRTVLSPDVENWMIERARQLAEAETDKDKTLARAHPLGGEWGMNWFYVNDQYSRWWMPIVRWKGHVMVCCHEQELVRPGDKKSTFADSKENLALYGKVGFRPQGQKGISLPMHTVIRVTDSVQRGVHDRRLTTVKEKGRESLETVPFTDFVTDYLVPVAKWEM